MKQISAAIALLSLLLAGSPIHAAKTQKVDKGKAADSKDKKDEKKEKLSAGTFAGLKLRGIGPALTSGRIGDLAVDPQDDRAPGTSPSPPAACGRRPTRGTTFDADLRRPGLVLDRLRHHRPEQPARRLGRHRREQQPAQRRLRRRRLQVDRRRQDAGRTSGLKKSEHIGKIVVDPRDSNVVYVAAQGPLWAPGGDRGLYKTTDGGKTWKAVLDHQREHRRHRRRPRPAQPRRALRRGLPAPAARLDAHRRRPGVGDLQVDRRRQDLDEARRAACPTDDLGRIGLAISPAEPERRLRHRRGGAQGNGGFFRSHRRRRQLGEAQRLHRRQRAVLPARSSSIRTTPTASTPWTSACRSPTTAARRSRTLGETLQARRQPRALDRSRRTPITCWSAATAASTRASTAARPGTSRRTCRSRSSTRERATTPLPFYNVYGGTQDNYTPRRPVAHHQRRTASRNGDWFVTSGGDGFQLAGRSERPEHRLRRVAARRPGALRPPDRRGGRHPAAAGGRARTRCAGTGTRRSSSARTQHTRLYFAAQQRVPQRRPRRHLEGRSAPTSPARSTATSCRSWARVWGVDAVAKNASTSFYGNIVVARRVAARRRGCSTSAPTTA